MKYFKLFLNIVIASFSMSGIGNASTTSINKEAVADNLKEKQISSTASNAETKNKVGETEDKTPSQDRNTITVGVKGMVCAFCATGIEKSFLAQPEVESIVVSLEKKFLKLTFKPGKSLSNEKITTILKDAGYEANFAG